VGAHLLRELKNFETGLGSPDKEWSAGMKETIKEALELKGRMTGADYERPPPEVGRIEARAERFIERGGGAVSPEPVILLLAASGVGANKKQKVFPCLKLKSPEEGAQSVIEFITPPEISAGFYKVFIAQYRQAVNQKRRQVQHAVDLAGVVFPVSEVVFEMVSAVLQDIVVFVLYLPTGAAALRKQLNILFSYHFIGNPTVFTRDFTRFPVVYLEIQVIYRQFFTSGAVFNAVYPLIAVFKVASPRPDGSFPRFAYTPRNLFRYPRVRFVFTGEDEAQAPVENRLASAVIGI
jgi:hypothetical protein